AQNLASEEVRRPFDLAVGPLLRTTAIQLSASDHLLLLSLHHTVSDAWSIGVLVRELSTLYQAFLEGQPSPLPELPIQYADFAVWQRAWLSGEALEEQLSYWRQHLAEVPAALELPVDRPRPPVPSLRGAIERFSLSEVLLAELRSLSNREGATLYMTMLSSFMALLSRYTGQEDLVVGSPIAGRDRVETEQLIGFFINTLVLRGDLSGDPS